MPNQDELLEKLYRALTRAQHGGQNVFERLGEAVINRSTGLQGRRAEFIRAAKERMIKDNVRREVYHSNATTPFVRLTEDEVNTLGALYGKRYNQRVGVAATGAGATGAAGLAAGSYALLRRLRRNRPQEQETHGPPSGEHLRDQR